jgi:O-antigen ligase
MGVDMWAWLWVILLVPLVAGVVVMCLRRPMQVALPIFAALVPFGKGLSIAPTPFGSASSLAGLLLGAGLVLQLVLGDRRAAPRLSRAVPVWLLFLATAGATVLWSVNPVVTAEGFAVLASLVLLFVVTSMSAVDRVVLRRTENGLLLGGAAVVGYGLYQLLVLGGFPGDRPGAGVVESGRFGNDLVGPNILALSLLLPLVIAVRRAAADGRSGEARVFHGWLAALLLLGILMTASRSGTIAVGLALVALAVASPRLVRRRLWGGLVAASVVVAVVWAVQPGGITTRTFESAASTSGRADIWRVGLAACAQYCGHGSGWGTFPRVYAETQATVSQARVLVGDQGTYQPHNLLLLSLVELGVLGALLLIAGLVVGVVEAWRLPTALRGPPLAGVVGLLVALQFLSSMEFKIFWMVVIYVVMSRNLADAERLGQAQAGRARREPAGTVGAGAG